MTESSWILWFIISVVGEVILWLFVRRAEKTGTVSFLGLLATREADDPAKYQRVMRSYRLQMAMVPIVAFLVAWNMR